MLAQTQSKTVGGTMDSCLGHLQINTPGKEEVVESFRFPHCSRHLVHSYRCHCSTLIFPVSLFFVCFVLFFFFFNNGNNIFSFPRLETCSIFQFFFMSFTHHIFFVIKFCYVFHFNMSWICPYVCILTDSTSSDEG